MRFAGPVTDFVGMFRFQMGFPGNSLDDLVLETPDDDDEAADSDEGKDDDNEDDDEDGDKDEDQKEDTDEVNEKQALDPRAGRVDVVMHEIKFNPTEIASSLEELKYKKFTRVRNRKCIDRIVSS